MIVSDFVDWLKSERDRHDAIVQENHPDVAGWKGETYRTYCKHVGLRDRCKTVLGHVKVIGAHCE